MELLARPSHTSSHIHSNTSPHVYPTIPLHVSTTIPLAMCTPGAIAQTCDPISLGSDHDGLHCNTHRYIFVLLNVFSLLPTQSPICRQVRVAGDGGRKKYFAKKRVKPGSI